MFYKFCPHCGGKLPQELETSPAVRPMAQEKIEEPQREYNQLMTWKSMNDQLRRLESSGEALETRDPVNDLATPPIASSELRVKTIIHILFDKSIVPAGGALIHALSATATVPRKEALEAAGYLLDGDKVVTVDEHPVGKAYGVLQYWGGDKQHRRWHMAEPITLNPSRHGELFMDENMIAFGAVWSDFDRYQDALRELVQLFKGGVRDEGHVALPVVIQVYWR